MHESGEHWGGNIPSQSTRLSWLPMDKPPMDKPLRGTKDFAEAWRAGAGFCQVATAKITPKSTLGLRSPVPLTYSNPPHHISVWHKSYSGLVSPYFVLLLLFLFLSRRNKENWDIKQATEEGISLPSKTVQKDRNSSVGLIQPKGKMLKILLLLLFFTRKEIQLGTCSPPIRFRIA